MMKSGVGITNRSALSIVCITLFATTFPHTSFAFEKAPLPSLQNRHPNVSRVAAQGVVFTEPASGGILTVAAPVGRAPASISVVTTPGESPESVVAKLQEASEASFDLNDRVGGIRAEANGFIGVGSQNSGLFCVAGTETGLGIPAPVDSVSVLYDGATDKLIVKWRNPKKTQYDSLALVLNGVTFRSHLDGSSTSYVVESASTLSDLWAPGSLRNFDISVVGYAAFCPSAAAGIWLTPCRQEEIENLPFRLGIAPNWTAWQRADAQALGFDEGRKQFFSGQSPDELDRRQVKMQRGASYGYTHPEDKLLYQILRANGGDSSGGLYRYFLGLQPGHAYRVRMRVNTLDQRADTGQWSYSLYALPVSSSGGDPSPAQLAGAAPFASGAMAGQAALFTRLGSGGGGDTQGEWRYVATDGDGPGATGRGNIVLPAGADSILVWAAYTSDAPGAVGFDWIALEDADCMEALR